MTSRLAALQRRIAARLSFAGPSVATRGKSCAGGRPPVRCAGFERSVGRARRSIRLQKSTSGARPFAPAGEELADYVDGSSHAVREHAGGEKASEAGSRWQSRGTGGGLPTYRASRESEISGSTLSMEDALSQGSRSSLTGRRRKRFWFLARGSAMAECSRGATGSVRGVRCQPCLRSTTPWQWERCPEAALGAAQK